MLSTSNDNEYSCHLCRATFQRQPKRMQHRYWQIINAISTNRCPSRFYPLLRHYGYPNKRPYPRKTIIPSSRVSLLQRMRPQWWNYKPHLTILKIFQRYIEKFSSLNTINSVFMKLGGTLLCFYFIFRETYFIEKTWTSLVVQRSTEMKTATPSIYLSSSNQIYSKVAIGEITKTHSQKDQH